MCVITSEGRERVLSCRCTSRYRSTIPVPEFESRDVGDVRDRVVVVVCSPWKPVSGTESVRVMVDSPDSHARSVLPIPDVREPGLTTYDAKDPTTSFPPKPIGGNAAPAKESRGLQGPTAASRPQ
jgi:hypothetical protein